MKRKSLLFDIGNYLLLGLFSIATLLPFWYVFVISTSTHNVYLSDHLHLIPKSFSFDTYIYALGRSDILRAFSLSLLVVALGLSLSMLLTCMGAYALSKRNLRWRNGIFKFIIFTMFFNGGLIPFYILISKMGLKNTLFAYFLPMAISTYNLILMKNYFTGIPESLEESAKIDGYNDIQILFKIIIPVSKPIIFTIILFYAVSFWNDFYYPMLFTSKSKMYTLALVLRNMIYAGQDTQSTGEILQIPEMIKAAIIVISVVPIMIVYPFIQKYFVQGIMLGSVKE